MPDIIKPATRKKIYDEHVRKFLTDDALKSLQQGPHTIELGDLEKYHPAYKNLEGKLVGRDTGESGTHKNSIIVVEFQVYNKKGEKQTTYEIYLKYPLTDKAREHTHFNWHYNEVALEDQVTIIPLSGGNGVPKTHAYSEYAGKALFELKTEDNIEDSIILAYTLGASVETIRAVFGEKADAALAKFPDAKKPTNKTLMDTLVKFPEGYLTENEEGTAITKLQDILKKDSADINELIREGKKYEGTDVGLARELSDCLKTTKECANTCPPGLSHTYREYEGAFQKGVNRILHETEKRVQHIKDTYTKLEQNLLQELGKLSEAQKNDASEEAIKDITGRLNELRNGIDVFKNAVNDFEKLKKKYQNFFSPKVATVSCPVDLIEVTRNLRILKPEGDKPQAYLIDQWLPEGKTFLDLRGSAVIVYHMLKRVIGTERDTGIKKLLENVCKALEIEFVNDDARTQHWQAYKQDVEAIVGLWHNWRNRRTIADRLEETWSPLPSAEAAKRNKQRLRQILEQIPELPSTEMNEVRVTYITVSGEEERGQKLVGPVRINESQTHLEKLLDSLTKPGAEIAGISFHKDDVPVGEYIVIAGRLQRKEQE